MLPNLDLDEYPKAFLDGLQCVRELSRVKPHQRVALLLDVCFKVVRCLSVKVIQIQQRLLRGHSTPFLWKHFSAHAMQNALSAHAFFWKKTSTRVSKAFFSTFETRFPVPRKMIAHRMSFPPGPMVGWIVHCLFSSPLKGCAMETRLLPLGATLPTGHLCKARPRQS